MSSRRVAALDLVQERVETDLELAGRIGATEVGDEGEDDVPVPLLPAPQQLGLGEVELPLLAGGPEVEMVPGIPLQAGFIRPHLGKDLLVGTGEGEAEDGAHIAHGELDATCEGGLGDVEIDVGLVAGVRTRAARQARETAERRKDADQKHRRTTKSHNPRPSIISRHRRSQGSRYWAVAASTLP